MSNATLAPLNQQATKQNRRATTFLTIDRPTPFVVTQSWNSVSHGRPCTLRTTDHLRGESESLTSEAAGSRRKFWQNENQVTGLLTAATTIKHLETGDNRLQTFNNVYLKASSISPKLRAEVLHALAEQLNWLPKHCRVEACAMILSAVTSLNVCDRADTLTVLCDTYQRLPAGDQEAMCRKLIEALEAVSPQMRVVPLIALTNIAYQLPDDAQLRIFSLVLKAVSVQPDQLRAEILGELIDELSNFHGAQLKVALDELLTALVQMQVGHCPELFEKVFAQFKFFLPAELDATLDQIFSALVGSAESHIFAAVQGLVMQKDLLVESPNGKGFEKVAAEIKKLSEEQRTVLIAIAKNSSTKISQSEATMRSLVCIFEGSAGRSL